MKKIFTFATGLLLSSMVANAESVTLQVCNEDDQEIAKSCQTEISRDEAGNYVIADFLNSGSALAFTFDSNIEVNASAAIDPKGNIEIDDPYVYILTSSGNYAQCHITPLATEEAIDIYFPYIYTGGSYTYVTRLDKDVEGNDYLARMCVSGYDAKNNYLDWYYIYIYFDEIAADDDEKTPAEVVANYDVTVDLEESYYYPDYSDYNTYSDKPLKPFDAKLEVYNDGTYTLKNIFGTDYSISYKLSNFNPKGIALVSFTDNYNVEDYFLTPAGKYMHVTVEDENGESVQVKFLYGTEGSDYSYVEKTTNDQGAVVYDVCLNVAGFVYSSTGLFDMYLSFSYSPDNDVTGVANIEASENAPVEYYNLQGVRVAEPSNGIFIRRQGNQTSKVAIK